MFCVWILLISYHLHTCFWLFKGRSAWEGGREREKKKERRTRVWRAFEILKYYLKSQVYVPVKVTCNVFFRALYFYWLRLLRKLSLWTRPSSGICFHHILFWTSKVAPLFSKKKINKKGKKRRKEMERKEKYVLVKWKGISFWKRKYTINHFVWMNPLTRNFISVVFFASSETVKNLWRTGQLNYP